MLRPDLRTRFGRFGRTNDAPPALAELERGFSMNDGNPSLAPPLHPCHPPAALAPVVYFGDCFLAPERATSATVSLHDSGYLLGDGVFATLRGYEGACFRPEAHLATLARGAALLGIALPLPENRLVELVDEAARRTGETRAYVRITMTRGITSTVGTQAGREDRAPHTLSIIARALDVPTDEQYDRGVDASFVSPRRIPPECLDPTIKTTSYAPQVLARREAHGRGAFEGIQLAIDGSIACGTMANVFVVRDGRLFTPPLASGCRDGVTRRAVFELASAMGIPLEERRIETRDLETSDEAFFTNTRIECLPIATIDGRRIGSAHAVGWPRTTALRAALRALVDRETIARRRPNTEAK